MVRDVGLKQKVKSFGDATNDLLVLLDPLLRDIAKCGRKSEGRSMPAVAAVKTLLSCEDLIITKHPGTETSTVNGQLSYVLNFDESQTTSLSLGYLDCSQRMTKAYSTSCVCLAQTLLCMPYMNLRWR